MRLYYSDILSARKACAVARHLDAPVEYVYLDLPKGEQRGAEHAALNPNLKVPTLVDGEKVIWEADAVICYLAAKLRPGLWPHDDASRIETVRWMSWNAQHFYFHGGQLYFEHIVKPRFKLGASDPAVIAEGLEGFRRYAAVLDAHLASRPWLVGDALSVADFSVGVILPYAQQAHMPLDEFAHVRRWHDRLDALPAWRDPFPPRA
jgi:glutathione S-transferase